MKKIILLSLVLLTSFVNIAQIYGDIFMDKRRVQNDIDYIISYSKPGKIVFDIVVDMEGKITSCILNKEKSTIIETGAMMKAKNKIIAGLTFERGYTFPKFHNGSVQITTVQDGLKEDNKFAPPPN